MYTMYMALHITNPDVEREIRKLAVEQGQSITGMIGALVDDYKRRSQIERKPKPTVDEILALVRSYNLQPINEDLTEDEILGYGPDGIPE